MPASRAAAATSALFLCTSVIDACTAKSPRAILSSLIRDTSLAIGPALSTCAKRSSSMPWASAKCTASARPVTSVIRYRFTASFMRSADGTLPQHTVCRPIGASSGAATARSASVPASRMTSCAASACTREPEPGAST
ncbi:hypothetical protein G6F60_014894 [Rhizopus arrhizus]|nr:hypothetical protein G6F60_014894 [Rhizopus arrhizus]